MARVRAALAAVMCLLVQAATARQPSASKWPALRFDFAVKRNSMNVYGQSSFSMLANPVVSDSDVKVLYDVSATITEGSTQHNYTLIDGVASTSTSPNSPVQCLDSESGGLPAINAIVSAINEAAAVSSVPDSSATCASGSVFKVTVRGVDFLLCALGSSGFSLQGSDVDVAVKILEASVDVQPPTDVDAECARVVEPSSVTSLGKSLLTGAPIASDARSLKAALSFSFRSEATCSCKSTPRPCVFIHGLGEKEELPTNQDAFTEYWGTDLVGHGPCCSSMKFARLNTVNSTWTSPELQQKVCDRALAVSKTSQDGAISDTIVVTHSMGNLMFAGALSTGKCSLDASSSWVGMAGPMLGSMCSDFVQDSCAGKTNVVLEKVGNITGRCPPNTGLKSLAYSGGSYSTAQMNAAYAAAQKAYRSQVSALMCGKGYSGLTSTYQAQFWGLGAVVPHKSAQNDGMVEFQSCAAGLPESKFGDNYRDRFYATKLNHYDMQFRAGDSLLDEQKMPLKWFDCLL